MTVKEAITNLELAKAEVEWNYPIDYAAAIDMAIAALTKQLPQETSFAGAFPHCPGCDSIIPGLYQAQYCCKCGQAIKWEGEVK